MRTQPKPNLPIKIDSEVVHDHYRIKNWVAREWAPIIGPHALMLYNIYSSAANKERGNKWYFSIRTLQEFTYFSMTTINMYNWLLEVCGLVRIDVGSDGYANEYIILDPPHVTPENLAQIVSLLKAEAEVGKNWQRFKKNAIDRINRWKPLHECGSKSQYQRGLIKIEKKTDQLEMFQNGTQPKTEALVERLVTQFEDNKPKLTKKSAEKMINTYGAEAVAQQLKWLEQREIETNSLKTLRAALRDNWPEPDQQKEKETWFAGHEDAVSS